jgi:hypothetical protein
MIPARIPTSRTTRKPVTTGNVDENEETMNDRAWVLTTDDPGWLERVWCQRLNLPVPAGISKRPLLSLMVRLLPYRWRRLHHAYAGVMGYFWKPCPVCGREFGGHEAGGSFPVPVQGEGCVRRICSVCTRNGHGDRG